MPQLVIVEDDGTLDGRLGPGRSLAVRLDIRLVFRLDVWLDVCLEGKLDSGR